MGHPNQLSSASDEKSEPKNLQTLTQAEVTNSFEGNLVEKVNFLSRWLNFCQKIPCMGITLALLSSIFFSTAALMVKFVPELNPLVIIIFQCCMQVIFFLPVILLNRFNPLGPPGERVPLFARGFFGFGALITGYLAVRFIPLSDATTICASAPIFVSIVACVLLKEECGPFQIFTVLVTLFGVLLVSRPTFIFGGEEDKFFPLRTEGTIIAILSCIVGSMNYIFVRKLTKTPSVVVIHMYGVSCIIYSVMTILITHFAFDEKAGEFSKGLAIPETWSQVGWLLLNAFSGVLAHMSLTVALKIEEAGPVCLVRTGDIIIAFVFQLLLLGDEKIMWTSYFGASIVFSGLFISGLRRWLKSKPGKFDKLWLILNCGQKRPI